MSERFISTSDEGFKYALENKLRELAPNSHLASRIVVRVSVQGVGYWTGEVIHVNGTLELKIVDDAKLPWHLHLGGDVDLESLEVISID